LKAREDVNTDGLPGWISSPPGAILDLKKFIRKGSEEKGSGKSNTGRVNRSLFTEIKNFERESKKTSRLKYFIKVFQKEFLGTLIRKK